MASAPRMLDLFCGRWGWSKAFAVRGWKCVGIDLAIPPEIPEGCEFIHADVLTLTAEFVRHFDFACASSPCEEFSVYGMPMFHANPPHPEMGLKLFNHTNRILEESGVPYIMENVRSAQLFVGKSQHNCGPFHLWGTGVPLLMPQGIKKGFKMGNGKTARLLKASNPTALRDYRKKMDCWHSAKSPQRKANTAKVATI